MIHARNLILPTLIALVSLATAASLSHRPVQAGARPIVAPINSSCIYKLHDQVGWTISLPDGAPSGSYDYTIKANDVKLLKSGTVDLSQQKATLSIPGDEPEMIYMSLENKAQGYSMAFGAAVAPTSLRPVAPRPADFDSFWQAKIAELHAVPENAVLTPGDSGREGVDYATIQMDHVNGTHVYGQIAKPSRPGKFPAVLVLQWASPPYPLQRDWVTNLAAQGFLALNIEPHDVLPREAPSYYAGLPDTLKNYGAIEQHDKDKNYFVEMYLRDYRAADYLTKRPDWDGKTLVVTGGSMGGQQSLCVAGLHPRITHVIVEEPAGCDLNAAANGRQEGYPFFPTNDPLAMETARYIDCVNFARKIKATSLVSMGFLDTVAPPTGIWTAFNEIRGPKEAVPLTEAAHNNIATREQQMPYYTESGTWFAVLARGEQVPLAQRR